MEKLDDIVVELKVLGVQDGKKVWMQGQLSININGVKPYGDSDIINAEILLKSLQQDGAYHIFSCCCGLPSCSGWVKKIKVSTFQNTLEWIDPNSNNTWYLNKDSLQEQLKSVQREVQFFKKYFKEKGIKYVGFGYSADELNT